MNSHKSLLVWQQSMSFAEKIYKLTQNFPDTERYGLVSQLRRAAVSIPSNIAEGFGRKGSKEFVQFLRVAFGSSSEIETQVELARRLNYVSEEDYIRTIDSLVIIRKMLNKLISKLSTKD